MILSFLLAIGIFAGLTQQVEASVSSPSKDHVEIYIEGKKYNSLDEYKKEELKSKEESSKEESLGQSNKEDQSKSNGSQDIMDEEKPLKDDFTLLQSLLKEFQEKHKYAAPITLHPDEIKTIIITPKKNDSPMTEEEKSKVSDKQSQAQEITAPSQGSYP